MARRLRHNRTQAFAPLPDEAFWGFSPAMADAAVHALTPAPTGRRELTKAANRLAILDAARAAFAEIGYEPATVRDIIRRTELSVGAFYNYFNSKEEVFEALAEDGARRFRPILRAAYERAETFEAYLRESVSAYFQFLVLDQESWQLRRPPGEAGLPHLRSDTPEMWAVYEEVKASLASVMQRGLAPAVDADFLAASCIAVAREVGERMLARRPVEIEAASAFACGLILGGLPALPRLDPSLPENA